MSSATPDNKPEIKPERIEDAINQTRPFRNSKQKAMVNIIYTYNRLNDRIRSIVEPHGLTMQQFNVLRILSGAGEPVSTSTIRERMLDKSSDTSRLVNRLCSKGWVERKVCPSDRRLVDVTITESGSSQVNLVSEEMNTLEIELEKIGPEEAENLSNLLDLLRSGLKQT